jgi:predicted NUDIX family phosphoesterase
MEKFLCIRNRKLKLGIQPVESVDLYTYDFIFSPESTIKNNKKIVPYVILKSYDTFIIYNKTKKIGSNKYKFSSLAFSCDITSVDSGGELNSDDVRYSFNNIISTSVNRNLKELLDLDLKGIDKKQLFWIYSGEESAEKNKLGIVLLVDIEDLDISYEKVKQNFDSTIKFVTKKDLSNRDLFFEDWSQTIVDKLNRYSGLF